MSELLIHTKKQPEYDCFGLYEFNDVIGMSLPGSKTAWSRRPHPNLEVYDEVLTSDDDETLERIANFFERTQVAMNDERPDYNCHMFAWYAFKAIDDFVYHDGLIVDMTCPAVATDRLVAAKPYVIEKNGSPEHSVIGLDRSSHSLSVLGYRAHMVVGLNDNLMGLYRGDSFRQTMAPPVAIS